MSLVVLSTLVSKFLPVLLSNIPFSPIQTWQLHLLCAWITVGCLVAMSLLLAFGLVWVRYPRMPIDPGTIAGRVYYLCHSREHGVPHGTEEMDGLQGRDSEVVARTKGVALSGRKGEEWKSMIKDRETRYRYGEMSVAGTEGRKKDTRMGVF